MPLVYFGVSSAMALGLFLWAGFLIPASYRLRN